MAAYQRRRSGRSQNDELGTAWAAAQDAGQRRQVNRGTYRRILAESADEAAVARHMAERSEGLAVIARAEGRSQGRSAGEISRSAAVAYARGPGRDRCSGPDCPVCAYGRQQDASRSPRAVLGRGHDRSYIRRCTGPVSNYAPDDARRAPCPWPPAPGTCPCGCGGQQ
jgi:hypothetical protein